MILNELSQHIKREEISLLISDQPEGERRAQKNRFFVTHESRVLIHVLSALEGVDEYQSDPVDLVVYAAPRFAGGRNYFLNAFGSHLGGYKAPEMLDMCGLSTLNADLIFFDPLLYILSEGELKKGSPLKEHAGYKDYLRGNKVKSVNEYEMDLFGEMIAQRMGKFLKAKMSRGTTSALAIKLNCSEFIIEKMANGSFLTHSRDMIVQLSEALFLNESEKEELLDCWAEDRAIWFAQRHPTTGLTQKEEDLLKEIRKAYFRNATHDSSSSSHKAIRHYLETGLRILAPQYYRENFLKALATIWCGQNKTLGEAFARIQQVFPGELRSYFCPKKVSDFSEITHDMLAEYFKNEMGLPIDSISLVYRVMPNASVVGFRAGPKNTPISDSDCKLTLSRTKDGSYIIDSAEKSGAFTSLQALRHSPAFVARNLEIPPNEEILTTFPSVGKNLDSLKALSHKEIIEYFKDIARQKRLFNEHGEVDISQLDSIALIYRVMPDRSLAGFRPASKEALVSKTECKIIITHTGESFKLVAAEQAGSGPSLKAVRHSPAFTSGSLAIPIDEEIISYFPSIEKSLNDFKKYTRETIIEHFKEIARQKQMFDSDGQPDISKLDSISLIFNLATNENLGAFREAPSESKAPENYCKISITKDVDGSFTLKSAKHKGASKALEAFRHSPAFISGDLRIPINEALLQTSPYSYKTLGDLKKLTEENIIDHFQNIARQKGLFDEHGNVDISKLDSIAIVFSLDSNESLRGYREISSDTKVNGQTCKIIIDRNPNGGFKIRSIEHAGSFVAIRALRHSPAFISKKLVIPIDEEIITIPSSRSSLNDLKSYTAKDISEFFKEIARQKCIFDDSGHPDCSKISSVALTFFLQSDGTLSGLRPIPSDEETPNGYCKIIIQKEEENSFRISFVNNNGSYEALQALRYSPVFIDGSLQIPMNEEILTRSPFSEKTLDIFKNYTHETIVEHFNDIARQKRLFDKDGNVDISKLDSISLIFNIREDGYLMGFQVASKQEKPPKNYCKITIQKKENGIFEIIFAENKGATKVLDFLRESPANIKGYLTIPNDGHLKIRNRTSSGMNLSNLKEWSADIINDFYKNVAKQHSFLNEDGSPDISKVKEIKLVFYINKDGSLGGFQALNINAKTPRDYCEMILATEERNTFKIISIKNTGSFEVLKTLRYSPAFISGSLEIPLNEDILLPFPPSGKYLDSLKTYTVNEIEEYFSEIARQKRLFDINGVLESQKLQSISLVFRPSPSGELQGFRVASAEMADKENYSKIVIERKVTGSFKIILRARTKTTQAIRNLQLSPAFQES